MNAMSTVRESSPSVYRLAAGSLITMFVVVAIQVAVFAVSPPPRDAEGWLAVYRDNPLLGFLNADGLYLLTNLLVFPLYVALWLRLRAATPLLAGAALGTSALSLAVYLPTNVSVELWVVASKATSATGEAHTATLGAIEALLASSAGTAFVVYYLLGAAVLVTFGLALRATNVWGRKAWVLALASGALMVVPSTFGIVGIAFSFASLVPWMWFCVIAVRRLRTDARLPTVIAA
jgi:hypothetical protein